MPGIFERLQIIDRDRFTATVTMPDAIEAVQTALRDGFDPADDPERQVVEVRHGQLLLMPADHGGFAGQKLATVAPANPERGLERIQALYIVLDAESLTPLALVDGTALTSLRTPAVSAAAADVAAIPEASSLVVFGTGPQGVRHVEAMRAIRPIERVRLVGRDPKKAGRAAAACAADGVDVRVGSPEDVAGADIVVGASTARTPVLDDRLVADHATVVAVGSHEPDARELPGVLLGRSQVVVETRRVARSEAGDVVLAVEEGHLDYADLVAMKDLVNGTVPVAGDRPRVVKTCGMGWQDLAIARLAVAVGPR